MLVAAYCVSFYDEDVFYSVVVYIFYEWDHDGAVEWYDAEGCVYVWIVLVEESASCVVGSACCSGALVGESGVCYG